MDDVSEQALDELHDALERSREDVAAGRLSPARPHLEGIRRRALDRMADREHRKGPAPRH